MMPLNLVARKRENGSKSSDTDIVDIRDQDSLAPHPKLKKKIHGNIKRRKYNRMVAALRAQDADTRRRKQLRQTRFFGSPAFRRLWFSQLFSSLGDWMGFLATTAIAARLGGPGGAPGAVSVTLAARMVPGFILAPIAGVIVDRYNRKFIMVASDIGRAAVFAMLPFVTSLWQLLIASFLLEVFTLLWSPAKEASVPRLVDKSFLPTANSLSLAAAYGPAPFAPALFGLLAKAPEWFGKSDLLKSLNLTQESIALYADGLTYLLSAAVIATLALGGPARNRSNDQAQNKRSKLKRSMVEAWDGLKFVVRVRRVRAVVFGLATGLIGGGMLVPMGALFATEVLSAGNGGYALLMTGMGAGVAIGILSISVLQRRMNMSWWFCYALLGAGLSLFVASLTHSLGIAVACITILGINAGAIYVLGFASVQANTDDAFRGRVFATLYTLTRLCILASFVLAPLLSQLLSAIAHGIFGPKPMIPVINYNLYGTRMTFWVASAIIVCSGVFALITMRKDRNNSEAVQS